MKILMDVYECLSDAIWMYHQCNIMCCPNAWDRQLIWNHFFPVKLGQKCILVRLCECCSIHISEHDQITIQFDFWLKHLCLSWYELENNALSGCACTSTAYVSLVMQTKEGSLEFRYTGASTRSVLWFDYV